MAKTANGSKKGSKKPARTGVAKESGALLEGPWRRLVEASIRYGTLEPWRAMSDREVFAVDVPADGGVGYCCYLGNAGEVFGLGIYRGADGLAVYEKIQNGSSDSPDDVIYSLNALMLEFVDQSELEASDRSLLKGIPSKTLKRLVGAPQFRSYRPGYVPWFLSADEAEFLAICLERACDIFEAYATNQDLFDSEDPEAYLTLTPSLKDEQSEAWNWAWVRPDRKKSAAPQPQWDELSFRRLEKASLKKYGTWEAVAVEIPTVITDQEPHYFTRVVLVGSRVDGRVLAAEAVKPDVPFTQAMGEVIMAAALKEKSLPDTLCVCDHQHFEALGPFAQRLGLALRYSRRLPMAEFMADSLYDAATDNAFEDDDEWDDEWDGEWEDEYADSDADDARGELDDRH